MAKKILSGSDNTNGFQKNPQNINLAGRPVGTKNRSTLLEKWLLCKVDGIDPETKEPIKLSLEDKVNLALITKALDGDVPAIKEIQDTLYGKIKEHTEISGGLNEDLSKYTTKELIERANAIRKLSE